VSATAPIPALKKPRRQAVLPKLFLWLWLVKMTSAGRYVFLGFLVTASVGMLDLETPVYLLVCAWTAVGVIAVAVNYLLCPRLSLRGHPAQKASAGQPVTATYEIHNSSRRWALDVGIGYFRLPRSIAPLEDDVILPQIAPGSSGELRVTIRPERRGMYLMPPVRAFSTFPFGFYRTRAAELPPAPLVVTPAFHRVSEIHIPLGTRYQPGGIALTSHVGESPEYIGNREYREGDPLQRIDFRSWARLARPVVREYQEEYYCRIALVLDTFIPKGRRVPRTGFAELEGAVSLSATVADVLAQGEYIIDLFAAGPELYVFRAGRQTAHFENVLDILAGVDACRTNPFAKVTPALTEELSRISAVVCVLLDWDRSRELLVQAAAEAGCSVKVLLVRDGAPTLSLASAENWTNDVSQYTPEEIARGGWERL
jgi:uncharacterized protein (DUF58 family)